MKLNSVPFGHLVRKFRSEEEMQRELEKPDGQLRRYDAQRLEPLLPPPKSQAPLGLTFVLPTHDRHLHDAVAWAGYWLKREFGYDWAPFQPEVWKERGWREAFIYVADTQGGSSCRGCGRVPLGGILESTSNARTRIRVVSPSFPPPRILVRELAEPHQEMGAIYRSAAYQ